MDYSLRVTVASSFQGGIRGQSAGSLQPRCVRLNGGSKVACGTSRDSLALKLCPHGPKASVASEGERLTEGKGRTHLSPRPCCLHNGSHLALQGRGDPPGPEGASPGSPGPFSLSGISGCLDLQLPPKQNRRTADDFPTFSLLRFRLASSRLKTLTKSPLAGNLRLSSPFVLAMISRPRQGLSP